MKIEFDSFNELLSVFDKLGHMIKERSDFMIKEKVISKSQCQVMNCENQSLDEYRRYVPQAERDTNGAELMMEVAVMLCNDCRRL